MKLDKMMYDRESKKAVKILGLLPAGDPRFKGARGVMVLRPETGVEESVSSDRLVKIQ